MPSLSLFKPRTETKTFDIDGIPVTVTFSPGAITGADIASLGNIERDGNLEALYQLMGKTIVEWDVTGPLEVDGKVLVAEGEVIPVEREYLQHLPVDFLGNVLSAVQIESVEGPNPIRANGRSRR